MVEKKVYFGYLHIFIEMCQFDCKKSIELTRSIVVLVPKEKKVNKLNENVHFNAIFFVIEK